MLLTDERLGYHILFTKDNRTDRIEINENYVYINRSLYNSLALDVNSIIEFSKYTAFN